MMQMKVYPRFAVFHVRHLLKGLYYSQKVCTISRIRLCKSITDPKTTIALGKPGFRQSDWQCPSKFVE